MEFFAVTETSVYSVKDEKDEDGVPIVEKIAPYLLFLTGAPIYQNYISRVKGVEDGQRKDIGSN